MDRKLSDCLVLARIPDLKSFESDNADDAQPIASRPASIGSRIMNQSLSFKLLAGLAMILIVASVLPNFFGGSATVDDAPAVVDAADSWQAAAPESQHEAAPSGAPRPMTVVSATPEPGAAPDMIPTKCEDEAQQQPEIADESPMMSSWPNPAHACPPKSDAERQPPAVAARPMAVRATEYQADARSRQAPSSDVPNRTGQAD